jgi:thiamine-phosphate diphosphorylase
VHIGQQDIPPEIAREILGDKAIIGLSAAIDEVLDLANGLPDGTIDYIGAGPVHPTNTKPDAGMYNGRRIIQGVQGIENIAQKSHYPVIAGGNVTADDVLPLLNVGASGVFVISAICSSQDPQAAAKALRI